MAAPLIGAFLASSIGPLLKRALVAIGFGTITYTGLQAAFDAAKAQVIANYGQLSGVSMQIADLAGVGQAMGIVLGALAARVGLVVLSKIGRIL